MRILAGLISFGRFLFGVVFIARPTVMERAWIGKQARLPGAQVLARAVGARDLALGLGGLQAVARDDGSVRPWLAAAAVCDTVDFGATYAAGRRIPRQAAMACWRSRACSRCCRARRRYEAAPNLRPDRACS